MQKQQQSWQSRRVRRLNLQRGAVNKSWRQRRRRSCCSTEGYGVTLTHRDRPTCCSSTPQAVPPGIPCTECEPETATATAPRIKLLQWDVSHCKVIRNVLLCPVNLLSSKFRAFKHTALPTATETSSSRIAQLRALL